MRLIDGKEETEAEVSWEDQVAINTFSKLNAKKDMLEEETAAVAVGAAAGYISLGGGGC